MKINFTEEQWAKTRENYRKWWEHSLERPLIVPSVYTEAAGNTPEIPEPIRQKHFADLSYTTDQIAERIVYDVARQEYKGDAFPFYNMDFSGPGVAAAYMGATISLSSEEMIWFHPMEDRPEIGDLHLSFDESNPWFQRTLEIIRKVKKLSGGNMVLGFPDLGGIMDIVSTFLPSEELLFAMCDEPDQVLRLIGETENCWFQIYDRLFEEFSGFKGYSCWSGLYSDRKNYIHQCDFSYMIGPKDFDTFVLPTLKKEFAFVEDSIYHLDGKGEIIHLEKLMQCPDLQAVQWVPGDGNGLHTDYPELMKTILHGGKGTFVWGGRKLLSDLKEVTGTLKGVYIRYNIEDDEDFEQSFSEFTAEVPQYGC